MIFWIHHAAYEQQFFSSHLHIRKCIEWIFWKIKLILIPNDNISNIKKFVYKFPMKIWKKKMNSSSIFSFLGAVHHFQWVSTYFTSDHPCIESTQCTLNTQVVWSKTRQKWRRHLWTLEQPLIGQDFICWWGNFNFVSQAI